MTLSSRIALLLWLVPAVLAAQAPVTFGVAAGTLKIDDAQRQQALRGILQLRLAPWLSLSASPVYVHAARDSAGVTYTSSGLGDLGVAAGTGFSFSHLPGSPDAWASFEAALPTGSTTCGLGSGTTSYSLDAGGGLSVLDGWYASGSVYAPLSGESGQSSLSAPHASSLSIGLSYQPSDRVSLGSTLEWDVGTADTTQALARNLGGEVNVKVAGPWAIQLEGKAGLTSASPRWAFALGLGTAFGYNGPVDVHAPQQLLTNVFRGGVGRGKGLGHIGGKNKNRLTPACS